MKLIVALIAAVCSINVMAGGTAAGTLHQIVTFPNAVVAVSTNGSRTSAAPACAAANPFQFAFDSSTATGKAQLAILLTAYASGKQVIIGGTGDCSVRGDAEALSYFYTND